MKMLVVLISLITTHAFASGDDISKVLNWLTPVQGNHSLSGNIGCEAIKIFEETYPPVKGIVVSIGDSYSFNFYESQNQTCRVSGSTLKCRHVSITGTPSDNMRHETIEIIKTNKDVTKVRAWQKIGDIFNPFDHFGKGKKLFDCEL